MELSWKVMHSTQEIQSRKNKQCEQDMQNVKNRLCEQDIAGMGRMYRMSRMSRVEKRKGETRWIM